MTTPLRATHQQPSSTRGVHHLALNTDDMKSTVDFYTRVMGMTLESFVGGTPPVTRKAFKFGNQKIRYQ